MPAATPILRNRVALGCAFATLTIAGCATTDEYVDKVNQVQGDVLEASRDLGVDPNASKREIIDSIEAAEAEARDAVAELKEVDVPSEVGEGHDDLVASFEELESLLGSVREKVEDQSGEAFSDLRSEGAEIDRQIDDAIDQINSDLGLE